jgi:hypothetical protein
MSREKEKKNKKEEEMLTTKRKKNSRIPLARRKTSSWLPEMIKQSKSKSSAEERKKNKIWKNKD